MDILKHVKVKNAKHFWNLTRTAAILSLLCTLVLIAACASPRNVRVAPLFADDPYWQRITPKPTTAILVTEGGLLRKYRPIARIFVDSVGDDRTISINSMREEGGRIGADAIIQITTSTQYEGQNVNAYNGQNLGPRIRHTLEGLAVIYTVD